nr:VWA domain-containing protein [Kiritimatiellia bacterium]
GYGFRLTASDGELTSFDVVLIMAALENHAPEVDAGEDFVVEQGSLGLLRGVVMDDGLPHGGELVAHWSLVSGPGDVVFGDSAHPMCSIEVTQPGEYVFELHASDGEAQATDEVAVRFGPPVNQPPIVDAGPDQAVDFVLTRTDNLLVNGDAELVDPDGTLTGWESEGATWIQALGGNGSYPSAVSGAQFFRPENSSFAELAQSIDVGLFADSIDEGSQLFEFAAYYRVAEKVRYDRPSVRVEYWDEGGVLLASSQLTLSPISNEWGFIADTSIAPAGTREIVVRLSALRSGATTANSVYFDLVTLRGVELAPVHLQGFVEDDGLPQEGALISEWRTLSGPVSALFESPESESTRAYFSAPGVYVLGLIADDGLLTADDSVEIHVLDAEGSAQLVVDAGPDLETSLPEADVFPAGAVDGVDGEDFTVSWTVLGENDRVFIENSETLQPTIRFYEIGTYTLRLSVSDGVRVAFDEVRVKVTCPTANQPLDVMMVIDTSGSMSGDRMVNARLAAMQFLGRLAPQDRAGVVRFTGAATLSKPLTFDHAAAIDTVAGFGAGGSTSIDNGISVGAQELLINGRVDSQWVILLLSDGGSNYGAAMNASQSAQASGVRIISIGLGSGTDENLMSDVASSRADYFFAEESEDLQPIYAGSANSFCRFSTRFRFKYLPVPLYVCPERILSRN